MFRNVNHLCLRQMINVRKKLNGFRLFCLGFFYRVLNGTVLKRTILYNHHLRIFEVFLAKYGCHKIVPMGNFSDGKGVDFFSRATLDLY